MKVVKTIVYDPDFGGPEFQKLDIAVQNAIKTVSSQIRRLDQDMQQLFLMSQGRVRFGTGTSTDRGENIHGEFLDIATNATPDTEDAFSHTLGSVPIGYIVIGRDKGAVIYDGTTAWTATDIYLRSNVATVAAKIFLLK